MPPMGPMMGEPWAGAALVWLALALAVLTILAFAVVAVIAGFARPERGAAAARRPRAPEALLRERYARSELTRQQYREALVDVLKDRYVRGEVELEAYEARLDHLVREPGAREPESARPRARPGSQPITGSRELERE